MLLAVEETLFSGEGEVWTLEVSCTLSKMNPYHQCVNKSKILGKGEISDRKKIKMSESQCRIFSANTLNAALTY